MGDGVVHSIADIGDLLRGAKPAERMVRDLRAAGSRIVIASPTVNGSSDAHFELPHAEVEVFLADKWDWIARQWGISLALYNEWQRFGGYPRCLAPLKRRPTARCLQILGPACNPDKFGARHGAKRCYQHGEREADD